jgi:hypothetical protein
MRNCIFIRTCLSCYLASLLDEISKKKHIPGTRLHCTRVKMVIVMVFVERRKGQQPNTGDWRLAGHNMIPTSLEEPVCAVGRVGVRRVVDQTIMSPSRGTGDGEALSVYASVSVGCLL